MRTKRPGQRFVVNGTEESDDDFDPFERFEVWDMAVNRLHVVFASPDRDGADQIAGKLNAWWDAHVERMEFHAIASGVL